MSCNELKYRDVIFTAILVIFFITPSVMLDYELLLQNGEFLKIPFGKYIFFTSCIFVIIGFATKFVDNFDKFYYARHAVILLFLFSFGVLISFNDFWEIRLFLILFLTSGSAIIASDQIAAQNANNQKRFLIPILITFYIPTISSFILEVLRPF